MASLRKWCVLGPVVGDLRAGCWLAVLCATACVSEPADESASAEARLAVATLVVDGGEPDVQSWQRVLRIPEPTSRGSVSSSRVAADPAGNAFVTGYTLAEIDGSPHSSSDAFVAKYSPAGDLLWTRQLGTTGSDASASVSLDDAGNIYLAGDTSGALDGPARGFGDGFVAKYSSAGELEWLRQIGTSEPDAALSVSAGTDGDVFVAGFTRGSLEGSRSDVDADAWLMKYSSAGELLWTHQLGSRRGDDELAADVSADTAGNVRLAGHSFGPLEGDSRGSADVFVAKLAANGELLWLRQRGGAGYDAAEAVNADGDGNVYVSGQMGGVLAGGPGVVIPGNPYVAKFSPTGELLWELELSEAAAGSASRITVDRAGTALIAGYTSGAWGGPNQGLYDSFVAQLSREGEVLWALQLGFEESDRATGVSPDGAGHFFVSSDLRNASPDGSDRAFLTRRVLLRAGE
ncbi:MAG: SBBP repeat-containing protein [Deltaproteobacteria bacterium]